MILSIMPSKCPERRVLAAAVAAAVQAVYRAKRAYDSAKMKNTENVEEIGIFLAAARKTEVRQRKHSRITSRNMVALKRSKSRRMTATRIESMY